MCSLRSVSRVSAACMLDVDDAIAISFNGDDEEATEHVGEAVEEDTLELDLNPPTGEMAFVS